MRRRSTKRLFAGTSVTFTVALVGMLLALPHTASAATAKATRVSSSAGAEQTMRVWDWSTAADTPAEHAALPVAISMFEKKYHVKIVQTQMTLTEQDTKLPLDFESKSSTPTVSEVNEGFGSMGRLVTDGELDNLSSFNKTYGWFSKVGTLSLDYNSFSSNGKRFGQGNVYAVPSTGSIVGIYYNKKLLAEVGGKVPTNWSTFTKDLALLHKHGIVALAYSTGQPTAYQAVHVLYTIANQFVTPTQSDNLVFHKGKGSIDLPGFVKAASIYQQWTKDGYFSPGYSGLSPSDAVAQFATGKAGFFITGDWYSGTFTKLGATAGFWVPKVATGGPGEGWAIPKNSPNSKLAAEWISTMLSSTIQSDLLKHGGIPLVEPSASVLASASSFMQTATKAWAKAVKNHTLVPYLDYATTTMLTKETEGIQELQGGEITPSALMSSLQSDYTTFWSSRS